MRLYTAKKVFQKCLKLSVYFTCILLCCYIFGIIVVLKGAITFFVISLWLCTWISWSSVRTKRRNISGVGLRLVSDRTAVVHLERRLSPTVGVIRGAVLLSLSWRQEPRAAKASFGRIRFVSGQERTLNKINFPKLIS